MDGVISWFLNSHQMLVCSWQFPICHDSAQRQLLSRTCGKSDDFGTVKR